MQLVDQVLLEQPAHEGAAAGGAAVVVRLEPAELGLDVATDQSAVLPCGGRREWTAEHAGLEAITSQIWDRSEHISGGLREWRGFELTLYRGYL